MTRLPPLHSAVAITRVAVREILSGIANWFAETKRENSGDEDRPLVLIGLSGGADSLALAAAVAFEAPRAKVRAGAIVIDHGLQAGSAEVAERAAQQAAELGLQPVLVRRVEVAGVGSKDGPEAAARDARYAAFDAALAETGAGMLFTAHTRDDQAEQVLLSLVRGSGTRAIAGIPTIRGAIVRPFLNVTREQTEAACQAQGLKPWRDPHNSDLAFLRVRVRDRVLPLLESELGPGVAANLARSAELAREDADALDEVASQLLARLCPPAVKGSEVRADALELSMQSAAIRQRVIRLIARERFGSHLTREHTLAIAALATDWRGQGPIDAPGIKVSRADGQLIFARR